MAIKPILFNTEMVRAIMDGRKSCTRRLVKPQPDEKHAFTLGFVIDSTEKKKVGCFEFGINEYGGSMQCAKPPYQPGDILYVRETWCKYDDDHIIDGRKYAYKADASPISEEARKKFGYRWRPSIHMPKEAARIWLKVTDVRVERLQDMTDDDAEAEGFTDYTSTALGFAYTWDHTIKKSDFDRYGWAANPWVWVIQFERCEKPKEAEE